MELLQSHEVEDLRNENVRLLTENGELRKMVGLMQENLELRSTLRDLENRVRTLSPPGKEHREPKEPQEPKEYREPKEHREPQEPKEHREPKENKAVSKDPKQLQRCQRMVGEIAFQLDRRILSSIFSEHSRLYGFTVRNIQDKIIQATTCPLTNKVDEKERSEMNQRYTDIMSQLKSIGYDCRVHPIFTEYLVNTYGIMKERPLPGTSELVSYSNPEVLRKMAAEAVPADVLKDVHLLLNCLIHLAKEDGKPLFIW